MDSGGIAGAGAKLGAAENMGAVLGGITGSRTLVGEAEEGKNRKFEGKRKAENRADYQQVHKRASEEIGTKKMADCGSS
jgi:hypothetical protein